MGNAVILSEDLACRVAGDLESIDCALRERFGPAYSHIPWDAENFLCFMPDKWQLSHILLVGKKLVGFWIASRRGDDLHTHRVGVGLEDQNKGYGSLLCKAVSRSGKDAKLNRMTLTVSMNSTGAVKFYESLGFVRQDSNQILEFLKEHGREAAVEGDRLLEEGEHPYYLYVKEIL